jgi:pimeloyl-ACP methyl ester carboxylesterase
MIGVSRSMMDATSPERHGASRRSIAVATIMATMVAGCGGGDDDDIAAPPASTAAAEVSIAPDTTAAATTVPATTVPAMTAPVTTAPATTVPERADPSIFDYEQVRPVEFEVVSTTTFRGVDIDRIKFESPLGGLAYGHLSRPVGEPAPGAAVLWAHGAPSDGKDSYPPMAIFACAGATSIVVDAPYARPGANRSGEAFLFTSQDRDEQIQLVVDMRRALDLLADLGGERFGFGGISYGSAIGGQLIGVDDRVEAAVLLLGNSGIVERFTDEDGQPIWPLTDLEPEEVDEWIAAMLPIEPGRFVGDTSADVLFMSGTRDPLIPAVEAERYHSLGPPGAELYWMDEAHDIPFDDMFLHNRFIGDRIGVDPQRLDACTDDLFPNGWDDL